MLSHISSQAPKGSRNQSCKIGTESEAVDSTEREDKHTDPSYNIAFGKGAGLYLANFKQGYSKGTTVCT